MALDLAKLEQLLVIAQTGNMTRAAEELGITQPALTRNVSILEARYGAKIFERGRSGASLTPVGRQIVEQAEHIVRQASIAEKNIKLYGQGEGGRIDLGIGPQLAGLIIPALAVHMLETRPLLRLQYTLRTVDLILPQLREGSVDMIFCAIGSITPSPEILIEPLGTVSLGILARSGHPLASRLELAMADLTPFPLAIESSRLPPSFPHFIGGLSCENSRLIRDIVLASDALWFSAPAIVEEEIARDLVRELNVIDLPFRHVEVGLVRLAQRECSPAMLAIAKFVEQCLAAER